MTYCVGILLKAGLVLAADSRTNAGVDYVTTFRKLKTFAVPGERFIALMSAGNLGTTQAVVSMVSERLEEGTDDTSLFKAPTMFGVARIVGQALREVIATDGEAVIVAGQIKGRPHRLFQVYHAGNFIEATPETPFLQIGETKYGKPILDRVVDPDISLIDAAKAALISFDSTMRSNISVGPPIDLIAYREGDLDNGPHLSVDEGDRYFATLRRRYGEGLTRLFDRLPAPEIDGV
jgi:putative proteasome-type protease